MLKKIGAVAGTVAAGFAVFGGVATAESSDGLVNATNVDALHDVEGVVGFCEQNINVLIVQVPVDDIAQGIDVPVLSPGESETDGQTPDNCASALISDSSVQDN